jgi:hypothetical protein
MKPTIGRIVHYSSFGRRVAAIITSVHADGDGRVTLATFPPGSDKTVSVDADYYNAPEDTPAAGSRADEARVAMGDPNFIGIPHGHWTWPPRT